MTYSMESRGHRPIKARSIDSGVRTMFGRNAVLSWSPGNRITNRITRYTVIDKRHRFGGYAVLGEVTVTSE